MIPTLISFCHRTKLQVLPQARVATLPTVPAVAATAMSAGLVPVPANAEGKVQRHLQRHQQHRPRQEVRPLRLLHIILRLGQRLRRLLGAWYAAEGREQVLLLGGDQIKVQQGVWTVRCVANG